MEVSVAQEQTLTIDAAVLRFGVSRRTIYNRIREGFLRVKRVGVSARVFVSDLEQMPKNLHQTQEKEIA